jgi:hypothetical protein
MAGAVFLDDFAKLSDGSVRFKIFYKGETVKQDVAVRVLWTPEADLEFATQARRRFGDEAERNVFRCLDVIQCFLDEIPPEHLVGIQIAWLGRLINKLSNRVLLPVVNKELIIDASRMHEILKKLGWSLEHGEGKI